MEEPLAKVADFDVGQRDGVTVAVVGEELHKVGGVGDVVAHGVFRCVLVYRQLVVKAVKCVDVFGTQPVMLRFASCVGVVWGSRHSSRVRQVRNSSDNAPRLWQYLLTLKGLYGSRNVLAGKDDVSVSVR